MWQAKKVCVAEATGERAKLKNKAGRSIDATESLSAEDAVGLLERLKQVHQEIRAIDEVIAAVDAPSRAPYSLTGLRRAVT